jgi:hypothetical protein
MHSSGSNSPREKRSSHSSTVMGLPAMSVVEACLPVPVVGAGAGAGATIAATTFDAVVETAALRVFFVTRALNGPDGVGAATADERAERRRTRPTG